MYERLKAIIDRRVKEGQAFYQTHTWDGKEINHGIRGTERRNLIDTSDIKGRSVLDIGCATGAECVWAVEKGATKVTGIDKGEGQADTLKELFELFPGNDVFCCDLTKEVPFVNADTVFCFSILHHIGYKQIWQKTSASVIYIEGEAFGSYDKNLIGNATLMGYAPNNNSDKRLIRPVYRLER